MNSQPDYNQPEPHEGELVLRPIVKYIAIGLGVATLLGVEYATYHFGMQRGYTEGVASGEVTEAINTRAIENLRHFMQVASADDAVLVDTARRHKETLAWIKDDSLRDEALWSLAQALITRAMPMEADPLMRDLIGRHSSKLWVRRALVTARAFAAEKRYTEAVFYYDYVDAYLAREGEQAKQLSLLTERLTLLQSVVTDPQQLQKELSAYVERAAKLGENGRELMAGILVNKGRLYREQGTPVALEHANRCFEQALKGVNPDQLPELASAAVCMGSLLLEKGDTERAATMIRNGLQRLADSPDAAPYMLMGLRDLARIQQEAGKLDAALALLYRAEGVAMTHEPEQSPFWNYLYDQRGWLNLQREHYGAAQSDFENALALIGNQVALRAQPLEGAATCCVKQGQLDKAAAYLTECLQIRNEHFTADVASRGRVLLALARIHDMRGEVQKAADAYGEALSLLKAAGDMQNPELLDALFAQAYALTQLKQWTPAAIAWNELKQLLPSDSVRQQEIAAQLHACMTKGAVLPAEVEQEEESESQP